MQKFFDDFYKWFVAPDITFIDVEEYMFQLPHFLLVGIILAVTLISFFMFRKKSYTTQRKFLLFVVTIIAICEIFTRVSKLLWFASNGWLNWLEAIKIILPIHFCSVMVWIIIIAIAVDNRPMMSFGAIAGFIGTVVYMSYPFEGLNSLYFTIRALNSMLTHGLGFVGSMCLLFWGIAKFEIKDMWKTFLLLFAIVLYGLIMNILIPGNNYMFMFKNPTPLEFGPIPYQLVFALFVSFIVASFYIIPFIWKKIANRIKLRKNKI